MRVAVLLLVLAAPAMAEGGRAALEAAEARLAAAETNLQQRRAVAEAIRAYQTAMGDLRSEISAVAARDRALSRELAGEEARLARVAAGLARLGGAAAPLVLSGTADPQDGVRGLLLLERAAGQLGARTRDLSRQRSALQALQAEQQEVQAQLEESRDRLGALRDQLIAWAEEDRAAQGTVPDLSQDSANLAALAIALEQTLPASERPESDDVPSLRFPVAGRLARSFGSPDAAGLSRPGIALSAEPGALVTAPADSTVRFTGTLDGYGRVVILEPREQVLVVLAGLEAITVRAGERVAVGAPVGFLPELDGEGPDGAAGTATPPATSGHEEFSSADGQTSGQSEAKTLYMEVRFRQRPVDPMTWLDDI